MTRAVHQLLPDFAAGDAIGAITLETRAMLRAMGFASEIYADVIDERLLHAARRARELPADLHRDDAVIYHCSIGSRLAGMVARLPLPTMMLYHNITPAAFYRDTNPRIAVLLEQGREQLATLVPRVDMCAGVSEFNVEEMRLLGARRCAVVPPLVDLRRLRPRPSTPQQPPLLVFVSRVAPNKRHDDLIRALAALRATAQPDARLAIVGRFTDTEDYVDSLRALSRDLGVEDAVDWLGRLDDAAVGDVYARASAYVCASEHEGFCVPLLEAMAFDVPIVAYAAGAVPDTMDGAGVLLRSKDPLLWAAALDRVIGDRSLRATLAAAGRRRLQDFTPDAVRARLAAALRAIGVIPENAL
ncbi:MAG TPA: glycosyltransferase family 4 protein [Candidatus Dormibacteraeota bacterium]|jgi:glycosyltransferase involved in cell wall biosynthesis|nr:glycosyltransferase family 4 protein [Candidatus Dormibacteraeota bacterium]